VVRRPGRRAYDHDGQCHRGRPAAQQAPSPAARTDPHFLDQLPLWAAGELIPVVTDWSLLTEEKP